MPWAFRFDGPVDLPRLRTALECVVQRHETLRTTFVLGDDGPRRTIHERIELPFDVTPAPAGGVDARIAELAREPFDLEAGPLVRAHALPTADGPTVLLLMFHHIVWDEGSLPILEGELQEYYIALGRRRAPRRPELPVQYADYSASQYENADGKAAAGRLGYWAERLRDAPDAPLLTPDRPRPQDQRFKGAVHRFAVPTPLARAVRQIARSEDATPFMVLLAGLALTLNRRSGQRDMVLGAHGPSCPATGCSCAARSPPTVGTGPGCSPSTTASCC